MVLRHTAALATDVVSGPSQGFQSTTAEGIQMSSQNEIQARLHCVCPLHACATHFPRAAQTAETPETPPPQGPFRAARQEGCFTVRDWMGVSAPKPRTVHGGVLRP